MNSKVILGLVVILFTACSTSAQIDRNDWHNVSCSGFKTWDSCLKQASTACSNSFYVRNQKEDYVTQARSLDFSCKK